MNLGEGTMSSTTSPLVSPCSEGPWELFVNKGLIMIAIIRDGDMKLRDLKPETPRACAGAPAG